MWDKCNCAVVWMFFGIAFLWDWSETDLFQSCHHCWAFQICWHIECSTLAVSSFRIWNSLTGILWPPATLFIARLPKVHLTSDSRISAYRWVIILLWFYRSLRYFLNSYSVYFPHHFLIYSACVTSIPFLSFILSIFTWNGPLLSLIFWGDL